MQFILTIFSQSVSQPAFQSVRNETKIKSCNTWTIDMEGMEKKDLGWNLKNVGSTNEHWGASGAKGLKIGKQIESNLFIHTYWFLSIFKFRVFKSKYRHCTKYKVFLLKWFSSQTFNLFQIPESQNLILPSRVHCVRIAKPL